MQNVVHYKCLKINNLCRFVGRQPVTQVFRQPVEVHSTKEVSWFILVSWGMLVQSSHTRGSGGVWCREGVWWVTAGRLVEIYQEPVEGTQQWGGRPWGNWDHSVAAAGVGWHTQADLPGESCSSPVSKWPEWRQKIEMGRSSWCCTEETWVRLVMWEKKNSWLSRATPRLCVVW